MLVIQSISYFALYRAGQSVICERIIASTVICPVLPPQLLSRRAWLAVFIPELFLIPSHISPS
jgi:hypothetical protein